MDEGKRIHKFFGKAGEDFQLWEARTEAALEAKDVLRVVSTDVYGNGEGISEEDRQAIGKARAILIQGLGDKPLRLCLSEKLNTYKMWLKLRERYVVSNIVTRVQLQAKLSQIQYSDQFMSDFVDSFEEIFNRLTAMGTAIAEEMQVAILLW